MLDIKVSDIENYFITEFPIKLYFTYAIVHFYHKIHVFLYTGYSIPDDTVLHNRLIIYTGVQTFGNN